MFTKKMFFIIVSFVVCLCVCLALFPLQEKAPIVPEKKPVAVKKEYAPIVPGAKKGDPPKVKVSPLTFNDRAKKGEIRLEIVPAGYWKSRKKLAKTNYDFLEFEPKNPAHLVEVGAPIVPIKAVVVAIPANAELEKVELKPELLKTIKNVNLFPAQEPLPLVKDKPISTKRKVTVNKDLYKQKKPYPGKFYDVLTTGYLGSYKVVILKTYPMQYYPAARKAKFFKLTGTVKIKADEIKKAKVKRQGANEYEKAVDRFIHNINDARRWEGYQREIGEKLKKAYKAMGVYKEAKQGERNYIPCVIICANSFYDQAMVLAYHHTSKGVHTIVTKVRDIETNPYLPGRDTQEKIRNFLKVFRYYHNTMHVILFGDEKSHTGEQTNVPTRMVLDPLPYPSWDDGVIPCDYYYACLDGTWDDNNNNKFGEAWDYPDLFFELFVGRIPVNNTNDAQGVVNIITYYENNPPMWKGVLVAANEMGWGGYEVVFNEYVYVQQVLMPSGLIPNFRMYDRWGNLSLQNFVNWVNGGIDFVQYEAHGSPTAIWRCNTPSPCTQFMDMWQVQSMINTTHSLPVLFFLSCSTARYDSMECFGEAWLEKQKASAYIGSTRVCYSSPGAGEGLAVRFIQNYKIFKQTGVSLDLARCQLFAHYGWDIYTIKTIYEFTLLGDPLMFHVVI